MTPSTVIVMLLVIFGAPNGEIKTVSLTSPTIEACQTDAPKISESIMKDNSSYKIEWSCFKVITPEYSKPQR